MKAIVQNRKAPDDLELLGIDEWRAEYNNERPHSSLRGMTPVQFFNKWLQQTQLIKSKTLRSDLTPWRRCPRHLTLSYRPTTPTRVSEPEWPAIGVPPTRRKR